MEHCYSHAKEWQWKFFFVFGEGWEFPSNEANRRKLPVCVTWGLALDDRGFKIILSNCEEARLRLVHTWVEQNYSSTWIDILLTRANINRFMVSPSRAHLFGR